MIYLTVIVPIYKAALYIEQCARSLMEQTLSEGIEFLFINDCTPDNSMDILKKVLKEYPHREKQITIINNIKNLGIFEVRRLGIKKANGLYIGWCDSDDWVEPTMYSKLLNSAMDKGADITLCNYYINKRTEQSSFLFHPLKSPHDCIQYLYKKGHFSYVLWNQIIKKEQFLISLESNLVSTDRGEDLYTLIVAYYYSKTISYVPDYLYHYRLIDTSLSNSFSKSLNSYYNQLHNICIIKRLLNYNRDKRFRIACNCITFGNKLGYKSVFKTDKEWFFIDKECHKDIIFFTNYSLIGRLKIWIIYSNYYCYKLYHDFIIRRNTK